MSEKLALKCIAIAMAIVGLSLPAHSAKKKTSSFSVSTTYSRYHDLRSSENVTEEVIAPSFDVEIDARLIGPFSLALTASQSEKNDYGLYGLGFRIDTPGFFFIGGSEQGLRSSARKYPVNTSLYGFLVQRSEKATDGQSGSVAYGSNMGLTMDIFLFNPYSYLTAQTGIFNMQGNAFWIYSFGIGFQF